MEQLKRVKSDSLSADDVYLIRKYVYLFRMCILIQENVYILGKNQLNVSTAGRIRQGAARVLCYLSFYHSS